MRILWQIVVVAVLTVTFVAVGVGWVQKCLPLLVEQAAAKPQRPDGLAEELPSACLEELAALESLGPSQSSREETADAQNVYRVSPSADPLHRQLEAAAASSSQALRRAAAMASAPAELPAGSDVASPLRTFAAEPKAMSAQSAEWNAAVSPRERPATAKALRAATLPVSVEEALPSEPPASLATADVLDLMRRLRADGEVQRNSARRELLRRGFSEVDLELAKQLVSPDAAVRKQLASALPRLASVDAVRWLMWLAADPQPDVRLAAITTLATTGDPALLDRVEALARQDSDSQIQAVADQIAKQRDLASFRGRK